MAQQLNELRVKMSDAELNALSQKAKNLGLNRSGYVRMVLKRLVND
jgi:predicted DNA binding CopG/RHH family protein